MIIKQEKMPVFYDKGAKPGSRSHYKARKVSVKVTKNKTCTRSKANVSKDGVKEAKDFDPDHQDHWTDDEKRSTAYTGIKGRRSSSKVNDNDPDYEPEFKKVKVIKQREIKTRSKKNSSEQVTVKEIDSEDNNKKIFIRIVNSKIMKTVEGHRKRKKGYRKLSKVFIPKRARKMCPDCNKIFLSSVLLYRHQLCVHFAKNCSLLRHYHLVKLSKHTPDVSNCTIDDKTFPIPSMKFKCKLCHRKFSKYCHFTMHHRKRHKNRTRPIESWLRYCSVKLAMQKLLVPFAKDRKCNSVVVKNDNGKSQGKKERTFKCDHCNKMLLTQYTLDTHKRNMHGDNGGRKIVHREKIVPPEPLFVCADCNKSKGSLRALNHHLQVRFHVIFRY